MLAHGLLCDKGILLIRPKRHLHVNADSRTEGTRLVQLSHLSTAQLGLNDLECPIVGRLATNIVSSSTYPIEK